VNDRRNRYSEMRPSLNAGGFSLSASACGALFLLCVTVWCCKASVEQQAAIQEQAPPKPQADKPAKTPPRGPVDPSKFALIIAGVGGEETYTKKFTSLATTLRDVLVEQMNFDPAKTLVLTEGLSGDPENAIAPPDTGSTTRSTAEEVRKAFSTIKSEAKPGNLVLIVLIGHGSADGEVAKFNLIGPDLSAKDYATQLSGLSGRRVIFVNCASSSGPFVKALSGPNRIVITATRSGNEQNATVFAEEFIGALSDDAADADKNGRVSLLEAFNYATKLTADWYKQKNRLATEHALLDDNGDGVGHEAATDGDGSLAKLVYLDSKTIVEAGGDAELVKLLAEKQRIEEAVENLKARKDKMKAEEYDAELEKLLLELAKTNQAIKARQK
jgi:hypothetical protein